MTSKARNLFEQLTPNERGLIAALLGFVDDDCSGFSVYLREIAPLPAGFTIGAAALAYLEHVESKIRR